MLRRELRAVNRNRLRVDSRQALDVCLVIGGTENGAERSSGVPEELQGTLRPRAGSAMVRAYVNNKVTGEHFFQ